MGGIETGQGDELTDLLNLSQGATLGDEFGSGQSATAGNGLDEVRLAFQLRVARFGVVPLALLPFLALFQPCLGHIDPCDLHHCSIPLPPATALPLPEPTLFTSACLCLRLVSDTVRLLEGAALHYTPYALATRQSRIGLGCLFID